MLTFLSHHRFFPIGYSAFGSDGEFKEKAAQLFYDISDTLSEKYADLGDNFFVDATDESLVMKVKNSNFLLSRQTPNHQIWFSTPISGSLKFDFDSDARKWICTKNKRLDLNSCLENEISLSLK